MTMLSSFPSSTLCLDTEDSHQRQLLMSLRQRMILLHQLDRCCGVQPEEQKLSFRAQAIKVKLQWLEQSIRKQRLLCA
jgi:hypothetical protein